MTAASRARFRLDASHLGFQVRYFLVGAAQFLFQGGHFGLQGLIFGGGRRNGLVHRIRESSMCWCGNPMVVRPGRGGNALARKVGM